MSHSSHSYKLQAFILKRRNYGEADKMVTVFSRNKGKQTLLAKGLRRITSRRAGALELFNQVTMMVVEGKGMDIVTEVQLERNYLDFSQNYYKTTVAYQLIELVERLTAEEEAHEELYELLGKAFDYIKVTDINRERLDAVLLRFKIRILELLGFGVPPHPTLESLKEYIESILEKRLVAGKHFEV